MIDSSISLELLNKNNVNNMGQALGMEFCEISEDHLVMRLPVDERTVQPLGILNGGASAALAESVGSMASYLSINRNEFYSVGLEIKCNHIRSATKGFVYGKATPIHLGKRTHLWDIKISDEDGKLICSSTLTCSILRLDESPFARKMLEASSLKGLL